MGIEALHSWIEAIRTFPKPVIAAVEGAAAGAGFSLVLACDMVVASTDSVFVMAYTSIGLSPDGGGSWFLSRALPRALANQWMMLGERIPAKDMAEAGLVNEVAAAGEALSQALALADRLNQRAPNALASIKELTALASEQDVFTHLHSEKRHFLKNLNHVNAGIGIQAFLDKQTPQYKP
jgi:enoyl-CoA hydratase/carnithine racemase